MRIRPSVLRILSWLTVPAALGMAAYFADYALNGDRGYAQLLSVRTELAEKNARLAQLTDKRARLAHRIELLKAGDPDLVEELARGKLMGAVPGQVAIPRQHQ